MKVGEEKSASGNDTVDIIPDAIINEQNDVKNLIKSTKFLIFVDQQKSTTSNSGIMVFPSPNVTKN